MFEPKLASATCRHWFPQWKQTFNDGDAIGGLGATETNFGSGNALAQGTAGNKPLHKTNITGGKPVARFDGIDDHLDVAYVYSSTFTVWSVQKCTGNSGSFNNVLDFGVGGAWFWGYHGDNTNWLCASGGAAITAAVTRNVFSICVGVINGASSKIRINGTETTGTLNTITTVAYALGYRTADGLYFAGDIADNGVVEGVMSSTEIQKLEGALAWQYGLTGSLAGGHPYISVPPPPMLLAYNQNYMRRS